MAVIPSECLAYDEELSALLDGELEAERDAEVRAHAAGCERCATRLEQLGRVDAALRAGPEVEVPAHLEARLHERIAAESGARQAPRSRTRSRAPRRPRSFARPAAAAVLVLAASLLLLLLLRPENAPAPIPETRVPPVAVEEAPEPLPPLRGPADEPVRIVEQSQPEPALEPFDLDAASDEELAIAIEFETIEDYEVIAYLEILELLDELEEPDLEERGRG